MGRLVYSTDRGRIREDERGPTAAPAGDGIVRIQRQTKGRGGKAVSVVTGLALEPTAMKALAKQLKQRCGTGGAVKDGNIEIQGDQRELIAELLRERGYQVKLAGG